MNKIITIDSLIQKVSSFEIPKTLRELNDLDTIILLSKEIEKTVNNIFGELEYENLEQEIIAFFKTTINPYTSNQQEERIKVWESGKIKTLTLLENIKTNLEQKLNLISFNDDQEYVDLSIICNLKSVNNANFDLKKLIKFCEELNSNYKMQNYLSCTLILRAVLNYIPPVFGHKTFKQVASQSGRSLKDNFDFLEEGCRKIADLHTHLPITKNENLPSVNQIEPYKAQFEVLLQEIYTKTNSN